MGRIRTPLFKQQFKSGLRLALVQLMRHQLNSTWPGRPEGAESARAVPNLVTFPKICLTTIWFTTDLGPSNLTFS